MDKSLHLNLGYYDFNQHLHFFNTTLEKSQILLRSGVQDLIHIYEK